MVLLLRPRRPSGIERYYPQYDATSAPGFSRPMTNSWEGRHGASGPACDIL